MTIEELQSITQIDSTDSLLVSRGSEPIGSRGRRLLVSDLLALVPAPSSVARAVLSDGVGDAQVGVKTAQQIVDLFADFLEHIENHPTGGGGSLPVGIEMIWGAATAPDGWMVEDGSVFDFDDFPALGAFLGYSSGVCTLPDKRGRMVLGASSSYALGSTGGESAVSLTVAQLPSHRHPLGVYTGGSNPPDASQPSANTPSTIDAYPEIKNYTGYVGAGESHNNMPPYVAVNFIIYTGV